MGQLVVLLIADRHQALLDHPGQPGLIMPDGKAESKAFRQLLDAEIGQLVVAQRVLQLVELRQHGVGLPLLHRVQSLHQAVGPQPVMLAEVGQQAGVVQHLGHHYLALHLIEPLMGPQLAADQGIAAHGHGAGKVEFPVERRRLQQAGHHGGLAAAQLGQRLLLAGDGDDFEGQPGLPAHPPQHIATPADQLALLIDAAVGHEVGIRHQLDGAGGPDEPGLLLVGEVQRVDVLLTLRQVAAQIPVEAARREETDRHVDQLLQLGSVSHHQPVADHQLVTAQTTQTQPLVRVFPHQVAQLQVIAEVGAALAGDQGRVPVIGIGQGQLGRLGIESLQHLGRLPDGRDQEGGLLQLTPVEDGGLRFQHGPA
ncbi:hypothetical protein D3C78_819630 [compost metagenome]